MERKNLIVIGGTAAGLSAASAARRLHKDWDIVVYEKTGFISYGSCGLPYYVGGMIEKAEDLVTFTPEQLQEKRNIPVCIKTEVTAIDRAHKTVEVRDLTTGNEYTTGYDKLVIATGARAVLPNIEGAKNQGVYTVRHVEDGIAIRNSLSSGKKNVVIIGAGYIGLEMAAEIRQQGHNVAVIEAQSTLLPMIPTEYSQLLKDELENHGVALMLGASVKAIEGNGRVTGVRVEDTVLPADVVIVSAGVRPNSELAERAGLKLSVKNSIAVDCYMRTEDPSIYACGDCAQSFNAVDGADEYIPLGTTANKQGKTAGLNVAGEAKEFCGVLGSQVTKVFGLYIASTGLNEHTAAARGLQCACCGIVKSDRASYYPGGQDTYLTLCFEKKSGRLLGGTALGGESVSGRINVIATALTAGMTLEQLNKVDFVYAPPVAPVYDPLLIAASQGLKKV